MLERREARLCHEYCTDCHRTKKTAAADLINANQALPGIAGFIKKKPRKSAVSICQL